MAQLITTLGPLDASDLGMILPHEHVFVDLRTWDQPGYAEATPEAAPEEKPKATRTRKKAPVAATAKADS